MSAVNSTSFANRKPKLEGDLTTTVGTPAGSTGGNGNLSSLQGGDVVLGSFSFTPTQAKNLTILRLSVHVTNDAFVSIKEGATTLATAGGSGSGTRTVSFVVEDATIAAHTYTFNIIRNGINYQYGQSGGFGANGPITSGVGIDLDDTHSTKNTNIIQG